LGAIQSCNCRQRRLIDPRIPQSRLARRGTNERAPCHFLKGLEIDAARDEMRSEFREELGDRIRLAFVSFQLELHAEKPLATTRRLAE